MLANQNQGELLKWAIVYSLLVITIPCQQMDVYSFGVLLCEMCISELPDPKQWKKQVALVRNDMFRDLILRCIQKEPEARPNMEEIINDLDPLWHLLCQKLSQRERT